MWLCKVSTMMSYSTIKSTVCVHHPSIAVHPSPIQVIHHHHLLLLPLPPSSTSCQQHLELDSSLHYCLDLVPPSSAYHHHSQPPYCHVALMLVQSLEHCIHSIANWPSHSITPLVSVPPISPNSNYLIFLSYLF